MSAQWIQKKKKRSRKGSSPGSRGKKKPSVTKQPKKDTGPDVFTYREDPEEVAAYTNSTINLDPDPENAEVRMKQFESDLETLEQDLAPLSDDEKSGMRDILEESK